MIQLIELRDSDATHQKKNNSSDEVLNSKVKSIIYQSSELSFWPLLHFFPLSAVCRISETPFMFEPRVLQTKFNCNMCN
jgi:hypothetical protein